jgi:hypothetical protein
MPRWRPREHSHSRIDTMIIIEIDCIHAKSFKALLAAFFGILWIAAHLKLVVVYVLSRLAMAHKIVETITHHGKHQISSPRISSPGIFVPLAATIPRFHHRHIRSFGFMSDNCHNRSDHLLTCPNVCNRARLHTPRLPNFPSHWNCRMTGTCLARRQVSF